MREPSPRKVAELVEDGIRKAQREYRKGAMRPLCWAPEYFITANVFQSLLRYAELRSTDADWVTLEPKPSSLKRSGRGHPAKGARRNGRCDVALWYLVKDKSTPRAVVEVKRDASLIPDEIGRAKDLLPPQDGLEFVVLASALFKRRCKDLNNSLTKVGEDLQRQNGRLVVDLLPSDIERTPYTDYAKPSDNGDYDVQNWFWRPVCFMVSRSHAS